MHAENSLEREFINDHQKLTRGFSRIIKAINDDRWTTAVDEAKELNRAGGPHIAFEEDVLYPRVRESRSEPYVRNLYDEHQVAIDAIQFLLNHPQPTNVGPDAKAAVIDKLQTGLDHAISCGTLLSVLTTLDQQQQSDLLSKLQQHRAEGKTMTDLANQ